MQRTLLVVLAGILAGSGAALAQTSANAQTGTSPSENVRMQGAGTKASSHTSASASANSSTRNAKGFAALSEGTTINTKLMNSLDAKKSKTGDRVEARTIEDVKQNGKVVLPKGTRLFGHVTRAEARSKGQSQSALGIAFDHAELRNGQQVPVHLAIQALATSQAVMQTSVDDANMIGVDADTTPAMEPGTGPGLIGGTVGATTGMAGGLSGGVGNGAGTMLGSTTSMNTAIHSPGAVGSFNSAGMLTSRSRGVFGIPGVSLEPSMSGSAQNSTLVSSSRNVHLASGTRMLLRVAAGGQ